MRMRDFDPPIIVNVRDRVRALRDLVSWLERAGHERIVLLDNASTYEPLLDYLKESPHTIIRLDRNYGSRVLWAAGTPGIGPMDLRREWFVYTDPDIVPIRQCPPDAVDVLREALDRHPEHQKAALGLYLDDVPPEMPSLAWEHRLLSPEPGDAWRGIIDATDCGGTRPYHALYDSLSDTTFALYRPGAPFTLQALRTGWPYQARHDCPSWYGGPPSAEDSYYLEHAEGANTRDGVPQSPLVGSSWKDRAKPSASASFDWAGLA